MNGQQLKNAILQLAIQGKLVPQDSSDEPASILLEQIRKEKQKLIKEKKIKKDKNTSYIYRNHDSFYEVINNNDPVCIDDELPFEIPESWEWVRLDDVCVYIQRGKQPKYSNVKKYPVIAQKCNQWSGFSIEKAKFIDPNTITSYSEERLLQDEDLLWNSTGLGTLGRMAVYKSDLNPYDLAVADGHVTVIRPNKQYAYPLYLFYYFISPTVQFVIEDLSTGSTKQKELATKTVKNYLIPLPPLNEQQRIVSKIEELLPYVEEFGKLEESLNKLDKEFPEMLKKSILQEAIQGKLVPQDPSDEPASVLLEQIRKEKQRLIKEKKIKKDKNTSYIFRDHDSFYEVINNNEPICIDDELPFEIPKSWEWVNIGELYTNKSGLSYKKADLMLKSNNMIRVLRGGNIQNGKYKFKENDIFIDKKFIKDELYLYKNYMITPAVSSYEQIGKIALIDNDYDDVVVGGFVLMLIPYFDNDILSKYLYFVFSSQMHRDNCRHITHKSGQAFYNISRNKLINLHIPLPPLNEQQRIVSKIGELLGTCELLVK